MRDPAVVLRRVVRAIHSYAIIEGYGPWYTTVSSSTRHGQRSGVAWEVFKCEEGAGLVNRYRCASPTTREAGRPVHTAGRRAAGMLLKCCTRTA